VSESTVVKNGSLNILYITPIFVIDSHDKSFTPAKKEKLKKLIEDLAFILVREELRCGFISNESALILNTKQ